VPMENAARLSSDRGLADLGIFHRDGYLPHSEWPEWTKLALLYRYIRDHGNAWQGRKDYEKLKKFFKSYRVESREPWTFVTNEWKPRATPPALPP